MMSKPKIEVLVGMIASGKSTYARKRAAEGALVVSHDDLTAMLHGCYRYESDLKPTYRAMMADLAWHGLLAGRDVVIDRTHLDRDSRSFWVGAAKRWEVAIVAVVFPRSDARTHALRRLGADNRGRCFNDWLKAAEHHAGQAEAEPLDWEAEGFTGLTEVEGS